MARAKTDDLDVLGGYSFVLGVIIALILGMVAQIIPLGDKVSATLVILLVILGLIVGFVNINRKEMKDFLLAVIAIGIIGSANLEVIPAVGNYLAGIVAYLGIFVYPAAVVVAIKEIFNIAKM